VYLRSDFDQRVLQFFGANIIDFVKHSKLVDHLRTPMSFPFVASAPLFAGTLARNGSQPTPMF
jgi:hypothetical protein